MSTQCVGNNSYYNQWAMDQYPSTGYYSNFSDDIYGMDSYYSPYDSIFGMGMPMMPMNNTGYYQQYYNNMTQMQEYQSQYNRHNVELQRGNDIAINSPDVAINKAFQALVGKITQSEQEQIPLALAALRAAVAKKYPNATEEQINDYVAYEYSQRSGGTSVTEDIRQYGSGSFAQGLKQGLGFGLLADKVTAEENISKIEGLPESRSSKIKKTAGRITGGATTGAAIGALIPGFHIPGAIIGAIIGGIAGYMANSK